MPNAEQSSPTREKTMIFPIQAGQKATLHEVGGKAYNLMRLMDAKLHVPPGFALSVSFFSNWMQALRQTHEWTAFLEANEETLAKACDALKQASFSLTLDEVQRDLLETFLQPYPQDALFAVRSSSPEEDLEGSSFAGAYETSLGITRETLESAIHRAFASCLDVRIASYKRQKGFAINDPRIAVVIQQQVASEIAGVGFSINPLNNSYDQVLFTANWGLGETVVSGTATPDTFILDKYTGKLLEQHQGAKETSLWLLPNGGTEERRDERHASWCLTEAQLLALSQELQRIEEYYKKPMDIEWAFSEEQLYLLQARPITTQIVIEPPILTPPQTTKRLYFDVTLGVQGLTEPLSPLAVSLFQVLLHAASIEMFGKAVFAEAESSVPVLGGGRIYLNLCNLARLVGKQKILGLLNSMDPLAAESFRAEDLERYSHGSISKIGLILRALSRMYRRIPKFLYARRHPQAAIARWRESWKQYQQSLHTLEQQKLGPLTFAQKALEKTSVFILRDTIPLFPNAKMAYTKIKALFADEDPALQGHVEALDRSLPGNVTVEMGLALYALHQHLPVGAYKDVPQLKQAIQDKTAPAAFLQAWEAFLQLYGHRGPKELEISQPRFHEQPDLLLQQLLGYVSQDPSNSPLALHQKAQDDRKTAFRTLEQALASKPKKQALFRKFFTTLEALGGARESHKFAAMYAFDRIRRRLLQEAQHLQKRGQIDKIEDIYYLPLSVLQDALQSEQDKLQERSKAAKALYHQACQQHTPSSLMDSRGRFLLPPRPPAKEGEWVGLPVSHGIARGPIKVLKAPDEKPLLQGDILVARATDPGWTPLFVNAAAIILEVGGPLQHGALVAREYGKPCVTGIIEATKTFQDGDLVEVNGMTGIIRKITEDEPSS
ncbi:MAG: hypothetical protein H6727_14785 [Myxococcales bacterium]|nr:hypothetical protein [Myxococcales bacterium]